MWTLIICSLLGIIMGVYQVKLDRDFNEIDWYILKSVETGLMGFLIGVLISFLIPEDKEMKKVTYKIEAIQDNNSISGKFFLGSGQIDGSMKYVFYYETNGMYKMKQLDYENVSIKYTDKNPKVEEYEQVCTDAFINNFALDFDVEKEYIIYVPKGTINNNYNLDAR